MERWLENAVATVIFTSWVTPITSVLHGMDIVTLTSLNEGTLSVLSRHRCAVYPWWQLTWVASGHAAGKCLRVPVKEQRGSVFRSVGKTGGDPVLRAQMGAKGYTFVRQKYSKQKEVEAFRALYTSAIANSIKTDMKILITGTAGFVGFHLANRLLADGHEVIGIDSINDYYDVQLKYGRLNAAGIDHNCMRYNQPAVSSVYPGYRFYHLHLEKQGGTRKRFSKRISRRS